MLIPVTTPAASVLTVCSLASTLLLPPAIALQRAKADNSCLDTAKIDFESPHYRNFEFESSADRDPGGMGHLYAITGAFASLIVSARVPKALLEEPIVYNPRRHIQNNIGRISKEFPSLYALDGFAAVCAFLVPFIMLIVFCRRCCCCACGGGWNVPEERGDSLRRGVVGLLLFLTFIAMLFALISAVVTTLYIPLGMGGLLPQGDRTVHDIKAFYNKTKHEVNHLLVRNYGQFRRTLERKLDSCTVFMGKEYSQVVGEGPIESIRSVSEHLLNLSHSMEKTLTSHAAYSTAVDQLNRQRLTEIRAPLGNAWRMCRAVDPTNKQCLDIQRLESDVTTDLRHTLDISQLQAAKAQVDIVAPVALKDVIDKAQNKSPSLDDYLAGIDMGVGEIKKLVTEKGDKLKAQNDKFRLDWGEQPVTVMVYIDKIADILKASSKVVQYHTLGSLGLAGGLSGLLLVFVLGLVWGGCGSRKGRCCCNRRLGGCFLSLATYVFAVVFGMVLAPVVALLCIGVATQRGTCDVAQDLGQPAAEDLISFIIGVVKKLNVGGGSRYPLEHVDIGTIHEILGRFSQCGDTPYSLYGLLGESLVSNITRSVGPEWAFAWLWADFNKSGMEKELNEFGTVKDFQDNKDALKGLPLDDMKRVDLSRIDVAFYTQELNRYAAVKPDEKTLAKTIDDLLRDVQTLPATVTWKTGATTDLTTAKTSLTDLNRTLAAIETEKKKMIEELTILSGLLNVDGKPFHEFTSEKVDHAQKSIPELKQRLEKMKPRSAMFRDKIVDVVNDYLGHMRFQVKNNIGDCRPAYAIYMGSVNAFCFDVVKPFSGLWFSITSYLVMGVPAMAMALYLSSLYHRVEPVVPPEPTPVPSPAGSLTPQETTSSVKNLDSEHPPVQALDDQANPDADTSSKTKSSTTLLNKASRSDEEPTSKTTPGKDTDDDTEESPQKTTNYLKASQSSIRPPDSDDRSKASVSTRRPMKSVLDQKYLID